MKNITFWLDLTQPNPWIDPTHIYLWAIIDLLFDEAHTLTVSHSVKSDSFFKVRDNDPVIVVGVIQNYFV